MLTTFHLVHRLHTRHHSTAVTRYRHPDISHRILGQQELPTTLVKGIGEVTRSFLCVPLLDSGPVFYMTCRLEFDNKHYNRVSLLLQGCIFNIELAHSFSYYIKSDYWRGLND